MDKSNNEQSMPVIEFEPGVLGTDRSIEDRIKWLELQANTERKSVSCLCHEVDKKLYGLDSFQSQYIAQLNAVNEKLKQQQDEINSFKQELSDLWNESKPAIDVSNYFLRNPMIKGLTYLILVFIIIGLVKGIFG